MVSLDSVGSTRSSKYITSYDYYKRNKIAGAPANNPLREKCPNGGLFLVRIFPHSVQMRENTDQRKLRI